MRYIIQLMAMLSDLLIIGAAALGVFSCWNIFPVNLLVVFLIVKCFKAWQEQEGFIAWRPTMARSFLRNMKEIGL